MVRKKRTSPNIRKDTSQRKKKAAKKKKSTRKTKVERTRNAGTLTEAQYFQKIRSGLRNTFRYWKPMMQALEAVARAYKGPNKRQKKEYQCAHCKEWFMRKSVEIDHILECGSLSCYEDIVPFIQRLTPENLDAFQILCRECHAEKTKIYKESKKKVA